MRLLLYPILLLSCFIFIFQSCDPGSGYVKTDPSALTVQASERRNQEIIERYHTAIEVHKDGTFTVVETIRVHAMGNNIRRGIFRDFPIVYPGDKLPYKSKFEIQQVLRNGQPEEWKSENHNYFIRIYLGNQDVFLQSGYHEYEIVYQTDRLFRFFDTYDEFYWNVTGNYWAFPIENAEAVVRFPEGAQIVQYDAFTGPAGDTAKNFTATVENNTITFTSTTTLKPQEGMTIAAAIPKGIVSEPYAAEKRNQILYSDFRAVTISLWVMAFLLLFYFFIWWRHGRDPRGGIIIPLFEPPSNWGPLEVGTIYRNMFHSSMASAAFMDLAIKGYIKIESTDRKGRKRPRRFRITTRSHEYKNDLSNDSHLLFQELFGWGKAYKRKAVNLDGTYSASLAKAIEKVKKHVNELVQKKFEFKTQYAVFGFIVSAFTSIYLMANAWSLPEHEGIMWLFLIMGTAIGFLMFVVIPFFISTIVMTYRSRVVRIHLIFLTVMGFLTFYSVLNAETWYAAWPGLLILWFGVIGGIFCNLLWRPTEAGRVKLDKILGFKMFLSVGEVGRIKHLATPKLTPELFESYMPYAMSLGVEKEWTRLFQKVLSPQQWSELESRSSTYMYTNFHAGSSSFSNSFSAMSSGLSSATMSTSTPPSSSGSGGGGSSGGGGGGGGGGGW